MNPYQEERTRIRLLSSRLTEIGAGNSLINNPIIREIREISGINPILECDAAASTIAVLSHLIETDEYWELCCDWLLHSPYNIDIYATFAMGASLHSSRLNDLQKHLCRSMVRKYYSSNVLSEQNGYTIYCRVNSARIMYDLEYFEDCVEMIETLISCYRNGMISMNDINTVIANNMGFFLSMEEKEDDDRISTIAHKMLEIFES